MKVSATTWGLLVVATTLGVIVHVDRWDGPERDPLVAGELGTRSLFDLKIEDLAGAAIQLERRDGTVVVLEPSPLGHRVVVGSDVLGPADTEALEGLWASLSMATTLRSVPADASPPVHGGRIVVTTPSGRQGVSLGQATADGVGVYGILDHAPDDFWVLEPELAAALEPDPLDWVARRLLPGRAAEVARIDFAGKGSIARGLDGLWRSRVEDTRALLSTATVDARLDALFAANFKPTEDGAGAFESWFTVVDQTGRTRSVRVGPSCDQGKGRLVDRGPGMAGCVDEAVTEPLTLPGPEGSGPEGMSMVEPRLLPHRYGRVLSIEQRHPTVMMLRRRGGGWILSDTAADVDRAVDETEVFGWYDALQSTPVREASRSTLLDNVAFEWIVHTDSTQSLRLQCGSAGDRTWCRRDRGLPLWVEGVLDDDGLKPERFTPRRLTKFAVSDVRALEIREPRSGVRQSSHRDLGTWRLDAPRHPAGDAALDEHAVEAFLAELAALRATQWIEGGSPPPERIVRVEFRPGESSALEIQLGSNCQITVSGKPTAIVDEGTCAALRSPLLFRDPLRGALQNAKRLDVKARDVAVAHAVQTGERWQGDPLAQEWIAWCEQWRAQGLKPNPPPSAQLAELQILSRNGQIVSWQVGRDWIGVHGENWHYAQGTPTMEPPESPPSAGP